MQTYLMIYRKEKGTGGCFTSKNRVVSSKSKINGKRNNLVSLDCIKVSKLSQNVLQVPISFFHVWIALRKMLHKQDCFIIKWDTNEIIWSLGKDDSFVTILIVQNWFQKKQHLPGGPVVKNLPCNAEDADSIPGQGTKIPHAMVQLSPRATARVCEVRGEIPHDAVKISCAATSTRCSQIKKKKSGLLDWQSALKLPISKQGGDVSHVYVTFQRLYCAFTIISIDLYKN